MEWDAMDVLRLQRRIKEHEYWAVEKTRHRVRVSEVFWERCQGHDGWERGRFWGAADGSLGWMAVSYTLSTIEFLTNRLQMEWLDGA